MPGEEISRLTVVWDARFDKFEDKLNSVVRLAGKGAKDVETKLSGLDKFFGKPDLGKAVDKLFDSTRFRILDSGIARVGLFGSSLEALGPIGLGVAGSIGAVALALNEAGKAAAFANNLEETAKRLHVTTSELQEFRFAIKAAGGDEAGADEALAAFSVTLGNAQGGVKKAVEVFHSIGIGREQLKSFKSVDEAIVAVTKQLQGFSSQAKDAFLSRSGLTGLAPLINEGADAMARLRQEAHDIGVVMDAGLVARGAKANQQFETLAKVIDVQLKSAFVDLAPVLTGLLQIAVTFARTIADIVDSLRDIEHKTDRGLTKQIAANELEQRQLITGQGIGGGLSLALGGPAATPVGRAAQQRYRDLQAQNNQIRATLASHQEVVAPPGGLNLAPPVGHTTDHAAQQLKRFNEMLAKDAEALLTAYDNELSTAEERAAIGAKRIDTEEAARSTELADLVQTKALTAAQADVLASKDKEVFDAKRRAQAALSAIAVEQANAKVAQALNDAVVGVLHAQEDLAGTAEARAKLEKEIFLRDRAAARQQLIAETHADSQTPQNQKDAKIAAFDLTTTLQGQALDADAALKIAESITERRQAQLTLETDVLSAMDGIAKTAAERRDIELRILDLQYQEEKNRLVAVIATAKVGSNEQLIAQAQLDNLDRLHGIQVQGVLANTRGPLESFIADNDPVKAAEKFQEAGVTAFSNLSDALASAAVNADNLGQALGNVIKQLLQELLSQSIKSSASSIFGSLFGDAASVLADGPFVGLAGGTSNAFGGWTPVGENGMEMVKLPAGAKVMNASRTNAMMRGIGGGGPQSVTHDIKITVDVAGANGDAAIERIAAQASAEGARRAYTQAIKDTPGRMARADMLGR